MMVCVRGIVAMLPRVLFVLLACIPVYRGAKGAKEDSYAAYYGEDGEDQNPDIYDRYNKEILYAQLLTTCPAITRLNKRNLDITTLKPKEIDVKEILNNILQGKKPRPMRERRIANDQPDDQYSIKGFENWEPPVKVQKWNPTQQEYLDDIAGPDTEKQWSFVSPETSTYDKNAIIAEAKKLIGVREGEVPWRSSIDSWRSTQKVQTWSTTGTTEETQDTLMYPLETTTYSNAEMKARVMKLVQHWSSSSSVNMQESTTTYSNSEMRAEVKKLVQHWNPTSSQETSSFNDAAMRTDVSQLIQHWSSRGNVQHQTLSRSVQPQNPSRSVQRQNPSRSIQRQTPSRSVQRPSLTMAQGKVYLPETSTVRTVITVRDREVLRWSTIDSWTPTQEVQTRSTTGTTEETAETTEDTSNTLSLTTSESVPAIDEKAEIYTDDEAMHMRKGDVRKHDKKNVTLDIKTILALITNLTYDYEWNLSEQFNKTILEYGVPTCGPLGQGWTTPPRKEGTTLFPWDFENTSVVSKCFVCGLKTTEIPRHAHCADAFAGDFLPLMPVDPRARGKIAGFRKYCRYIDTSNYIENPDDPRAIYGRFTGGCAVRWTDLTGVFTQRTCRSKFRPLMGKHLASKRMAKLELALVNVENGCIISPMATLLPVSRGISLYARFHACVCSSNWCNRASLEKFSFSTLVTTVLAYWLVHYP